jgi:hypothetical protein
MEETEKKTSDQEADDLKGTGREGIQLAKELGQVVKKSAGNNAGSLSESEKGEGIPASLQGGRNPLDLPIPRMPPRSRVIRLQPKEEENP